VKEIWHLAMFFGGGGVKVGVALVLWLAGLIAIVRNRHAGEANAFWHGALIGLWGVFPALILALISLREPLFLDRYMVFSLPATILLASLGMNTLRRCNIGVLLVIALCAMSLPAVVQQYGKPHEDWRGASDLVLTSATPGDAVVFFPFYTRIMLDYYRDRLGAAAPPLHVFAPAYYASGEDERNLLAVLDRDPNQFRHVWVFVAGHDAQLPNFERGTAVEEKLQSIFGAPAEHRFADIEVLEFGS
jgi:hypothetical protein